MVHVYTIEDDRGSPYALGIECPGVTAPLGDPARVAPHAGCRRFYRAARGWWECGGCGRTVRGSTLEQMQRGA